MSRDRTAHPRLGAPLDDAVVVRPAEQLARDDVAGADLVIVGVSSPGIGWAADQLARLRPDCPVALVTKGLVPRPGAPPETYADAMPRLLADRGAAVPPLVFIGGPCIARELALRQMTAVIYAAADPRAADQARALLRTDYYAIARSTDVRGVEACAALKNFLAIGVSAMLGAYALRRGAGQEPAGAARSRSRSTRWRCSRPGSAARRRRRTGSPASATCT